MELKICKDEDGHAYILDDKGQQVYLQHIMDMLDESSQMQIVHLAIMMADPRTKGVAQMITSAQYNNALINYGTSLGKEMSEKGKLK